MTPHEHAETLLSELRQLLDRVDTCIGRIDRPATRDSIRAGALELMLLRAHRENEQQAQTIELLRAQVAKVDELIEKASRVYDVEGVSCRMWVLDADEFTTWLHKEWAALAAVSPSEQTND